jgi:integrase
VGLQSAGAVEACAVISDLGEDAGCEEWAETGEAEEDFGIGLGLRWHRMKQADARAKAGELWRESDYVFTTRTGRPVEPRNLYRSFTRVAHSAGLRVIRLHDARHGTATLLTAAGVAPRVVMEILGHSQISITMDVYTHVVQDTQREAMSHMDRLLRKRRPGRQ